MKGVKALRNRLLFVSLLLFLTLLHAAEPARNLGVGATPDKRIALVIGNSAYPGVAALKNPANDATDMAAKLRRLGFRVSLKTNVGQKDMLRALTDFGEKVEAGSEVLFFYAGHGMQVRGRNYLVPVDAEIKSEGSVSSEAVDVDQLLDKLAPARLSIVILDACRNNPFERRFRGNGQGLAQINAPTGTLIAYATAPGKVASDGEGRNGLYTAELLAAMDSPGSKIEDVFKRVRANVVKKSGENQIPWESSSLTGDFFFRPPAGGAVAEPAIGPGPAPAAADPAAVELSFWDGVKDSRDAEAFKTYLDQYPDGRFAAVAKVRLKELSAPTPAKQRARATELIEGTWEYQMPDNRAHIAIHWNPATEQYEGVLMRHGDVSRWVGFTLGEIVWKAKPTDDPVRLREQVMMRTGANGVSTSLKWLDGELNLERTTTDELVTSFGRLRRIDAGATAPRKATGTGPSLSGQWVGRDGAWYVASHDGNRLVLKTDTRPVTDEEAISTYSLVGKVPIVSVHHAEYQLELRGNRLSGSWNRAAIAADKCQIPPDSAATEGEWLEQEGRLVLRHDRGRYKAATQMSLLGDDSCGGVTHLGRSPMEDVLDGPLGSASPGVGYEGMTSWWDGGLTAVKFGWQGRLRVRVAANSPAYLAGLRDEDEIIRIDTVPVASLTAGETMKRLHGAPGSRVVLDVKRKGGNDSLRIEVPRVELR